MKDNKVSTERLTPRDLRTNYGWCRIQGYRRKWDLKLLKE
jgi:hypothetical protein